MMRRTIATLAAASIIGAGMAPVYAKTPGSLSDLVGARAPGAESEMQDRGYKMQSFKNGGQYWWNGDSDTCVRVVVSQGRYASVDKTDSSDCGKGGGGGNAAAAVGAVAAIGLIAALASHKKKHGDDHGTADHDSEYSRGYNDGLYGGQYDRSDSEGYHDGYMAGETEASNRRASNRGYARGGGSDAARAACESRGDQYQNAPGGSSVAVSQRSDRLGNMVFTIATGHYRSLCTADASGRVLDISPY